MKLTRLTPAIGDDLHDMCLGLRQKGDDMMGITTFVDTLCANAVKVFMFPTPDQTDALCMQLVAEVDATVLNARHFIIRLTPAPLTVQYALY